MIDLDFITNTRDLTLFSRRTRISFSPTCLVNSVSIKIDLTKDEFEIPINYVYLLPKLLEKRTVYYLTISLSDHYTSTYKSFLPIYRRFSCNSRVQTFTVDVKGTSYKYSGNESFLMNSKNCLITKICKFRMIDDTPVLKQIIIKIDNSVIGNPAPGEKFIMNKILPVINEFKSELLGLDRRSLDIQYDLGPVEIVFGDIDTIKWGEMIPGVSNYCIQENFEKLLEEDIDHLSESLEDAFNVNERLF